MADRRRRDAGFNLVEMMISVAIIAVITAALATTVTTVLSTTPPAETRANDARSMQGLVTWLPQDVDATPPDGFDRDPTAWPCAGEAPTASHNALAMQWVERTDISVTFAVSYRYELIGDDWQMARYVCDDGGTGSPGVHRRINLTSALAAWDDDDPPVEVVMCAATISTGGACSPADLIDPAIMRPEQVRALQLAVTRYDGVVATMDAAPKNPDQDLADDPYASSNQAPKLGNSVNHTLTMYAGDTVLLDLVETHDPYDPDDDPISVALDSTEPLPPGISVITSDPLNVEITAEPELVPGTLNRKIVLIVSDNHAGWVDATITVVIAERPNADPVLWPSEYIVQVDAGDRVLVPVDITHNASDQDGDPLTATVLSHGYYVDYAFADGLTIHIRTRGSAPTGLLYYPVTFEVADEYGGSAIGLIWVEIVPSDPPNSGPSASPGEIDIEMYADDSVTLDLTVSHGVSDPDGDPLSVDLTGEQPPEITTTIDGDLEVTLTSAAGLFPGPILEPVRLRVRDVQGETVTLSVNVTIIPTPPPPPTCVLGALGVTPSAVQRQGKGAPAHLLKDDVTVTLHYTGACDGLALNYDSGDTSGLGTNRVFSSGTPAQIVILGKGSSGTEKWTAGVHTLTASTTSAVASGPTSLSIDLEVG